MPNITQSMRLFERLLRYNLVGTVQYLLDDLIDNERVRFSSLAAFHMRATRHHGLVLRKNDIFFETNEKDQKVPRGRQLFYVHNAILLRVKTHGTKFRPVPHLTVSLAESLAWDDEAAKFDRSGKVTPRVGPVSSASRAGHWRALLRIGPTAEAIQAADDRWADTCHYNFVEPFDAAVADSLKPAPPL